MQLAPFHHEKVSSWNSPRLGSQRLYVTVRKETTGRYLGFVSHPLPFCALSKLMTHIAVLAISARSGSPRRAAGCVLTSWKRKRNSPTTDNYWSEKRPCQLSPKPCTPWQKWGLTRATQQCHKGMGAFSIGHSGLRSHAL